MSRHLFGSVVPLLLLVLMYCGGGAAYAQATDSRQASAARLPDASPASSADSITVPSVVEVNGVVAVIAQANYGGATSTILAKPIEPTELSAVWTLPVTVAGASQAGVVNTRSSAGVPSFFNPTAAVKGTKIYVLLGAHWPPPPEPTESSSHNSYPWLVTGEIGGVSAGDSTKTIIWENLTSLNSEVEAQFRGKSFLHFSPSGGAGILKKDGTLVFPVKALIGEGKTVSLILYSNKPESNAWSLSKGMVTADGCSGSAVVELGDGELLMTLLCDEGHIRVYTSSNMGDTWTEAVGTLSRVWGNSHDRTGSGVQGGFTTTTIEGKTVMLATLPVHSEDATGVERGRLHLWLTDGQRIVDVGPISAADADVAGSALLYRTGGGGEMISVYEKGGGTSPLNLFSVRLTEQLEQVKKVVRTWKEVDSRVSRACDFSGAGKDYPSGKVCSTPMPTAGLVGYLSGNFSGSTWKDEYLGVNATVRGPAVGETSLNGLTFSASGSWAEWPVGKQGQHQLYHFANNGFTLVATVSIHKVPSGSGRSIPLMGVKTGETDSVTLVGLSYTHEMKWETTFNGETSKHDGTWELGKEYQVAIVRQGGNQVSAYINGQRLGNPRTISATGGTSQEISHFYIGGDGSSTGDTQNEKRVTVTNVFLYNRPLSTEDFPKYGAGKVTVAPPAAETAPKEPSHPAADYSDVVLARGGDPARAGTGAGTSVSGGAGSGATHDSTTRGCVSQVLWLVLLGLWGIAALC